MSKLSSLTVLPAAFRRRVWSYEESLRAALGKDQMGFPRRPTPRARVRQVRPRRKSIERRVLAAPASLLAGAVGSPACSAMTFATAQFGVELKLGESSATATTLRRATAEGWPLVALSACAGISVRAADLLPYMRSGGTIFVSGVAPDTTDWLQSLAAELDTDLPHCRALPAPASHVTFSESRPDLMGEMSGLRIENGEGTCFLDRSVGGEPLAWLNVGADAVAAVVEVAAHGGRLILAVGPAPRSGTPAEIFQPEQALSLLPAMLVVRSIYGEAAWHSPVAMANFTIDDPVLRQGLLGLDFVRALKVACEDDFHITVATVPRELPLADDSTIRLLAANHRRVTACYHGNDHDGYEFFASENGRSRFRHRPLPVQQAAIRQAAARGREFADRTGHAIDRVMVFPHGLCPASLIGDMGTLGFLASSNWLDRYPLGSPRPADADLGMRPADVAWDGFPLLWRRPLEDETFPFDLLVGRPVLYFTHRKQAGETFEPLSELANRINDVAVERVQWRGLEEIARHSYVQRHRPGAGSWDVLMTANIACIHNNSGATRRYRVHRPHLPWGTQLVSGVVRADGPKIEVDVAPGATALVGIEGPDVNALPDPLDRRRCSVMEHVK